MKTKNYGHGVFVDTKKLIFLCLTAALLLVVFCLFFQNNKAGALNNNYYIDCSAAINGTGTIGSPWNTTQELYDHQRPPGPYTFGANDRVHIRRGTTCNYPIRMIRGSGTPANPVIITTYDTGARPIINGSNVEVDNWDGPGTGDSSAVQIRDFDNITIEGLELTNTGGGNLESRRQGIWVFTNEAYGARRNITIRDNYIHDIWGEYKKNTEATAGILIEQRLPPIGVDPNPDPAWYENILIEDNIIENTNRQGINLWGDWRNRPEDGYNPTGPAWTAWTDVVIRNNEINHVRGDAILISNTDGAIAENNIVNGFNELNGLDDATILAIRTDAMNKQGLGSLPSRNHAGIWTYNADNTLIQNNDVRGGVSNRDGMAFDIDGGSVGTIIQYNYSQDNEGGFALVCGELGQIRDGKIRYNISKNDGYASITTCVGEVLSTEIYNNSIYSTASTLVYPFYQVDWERFGGDPMNDTREIDIRNNIFSYPNDDFEEFFFNVRDDTGLTPGQVNANTTANNNIYHGVEVPAQDSNGTLANPFFRNISLGANGFELFSISQAINSGDVISNNGGVDYFGESIGTPPNIGAVEEVSADNDGLDDVIENAAPNTGDGNGDGYPDAIQAHVGSVINDVTNEYMTLQIMDSDSSTGDPSMCTTINSLSAQEETTVEDEENYEYPIGLIDFSLTCSSPGDSAYITIFLDDEYDTSDWTLRKYNDEYTEVENVVFDTTIVGSNTVTTISYEVEDGGDLDEDGIANGTIVDPIGPAVLADTTSGSGGPSTPSGSPASNNTLQDTGIPAFLPVIIGLFIIGSCLTINTQKVKTYSSK